MFDESKEIIIQGTTEAGKPFRPSDWAKRLCGMMSVFGAEKKVSYSPFLKPITSDGVRCVVVDKGLETSDPVAFGFLMNFANDNELKLRPGRKQNRPSDITADPAYAPIQAQ